MTNLEFPADLTPFVSLDPSAIHDTSAPFLVGPNTPDILTSGWFNQSSPKPTKPEDAPWYVKLTQYGGLALLGVLLVVVGAFVLLKD